MASSLVARVELPVVLLPGGVASSIAREGLT